MPGEYAKETSVPVDRSKAEVEKILTRYGAEQFMYGTDNNRAVIYFRMEGRHVKFVMDLPSDQDRTSTHTPTGQHRSPNALKTALDKEIRRRWRAMVLIIKAKLEAIQSGLVTFEAEFLPYFMLPNGQTVAEWAGPGIEQAYQTGQMPKQLPGLGETGESR